MSTEATLDALSWPELRAKGKEAGIDKITTRAALTAALVALSQPAEEKKVFE